MLFFRQLQHLLPDAMAWRLTVKKTLRKFFQGLAAAPAEARDFIDAVYWDLFPDSTRELELWEKQFGLTPAATESARRQQIAGAWAAQGGQSPRYLQDVVQAAGFNVYVHEWWEPGTDPRVCRDPRDYAAQPLMGATQCGGQYAYACAPNAPLPPQPRPATEVLRPQCNRWLLNEVGYLVNGDYSLYLGNSEYAGTAPPPIPEDAARWRYFLYFCGETFGTKAEVPRARRTEFKQLLLKLCPAQQWIVTYVDYV